jgi:RNA polymerase sigma-70 factor (ECF subfamily)
MNDRGAGRDDEELIRLCLAGESGAFDALVARHHRGIYNMAYRMLGNAEDASDLTQETFLRAYTRLDTFKSGNPFTAWIRRVGANLCIDHLRRRGTPDVSLDQQIEAGRQHADDTPGSSPEEALEMAEDSRRVLSAVQQLPEKQRAVLILRHIEGMKLEEIAQSLRMPLGTVKTMLFRGRAAVREMVGEL